MKITLHFKRHFSGKLGREEIQVHGAIARHIHDDNETERLANTMIHILQEGARENFIRLFLKNDTSNNAMNDMPTDNKPATIAIKARCEVAELQAKQWRAKYEQAMRKLYGKTT
jgi:hypothetical protein